MNIVGGGGNCRQPTIVLVQAIHMKEVYQGLGSILFCQFKKISYNSVLQKINSNLSIPIPTFKILG